MLLESKFVYISSKERVYNGRTFMNVVIESDDEALTMSTEANIVSSLEKYKEYVGVFQYRTYQGSGRLSLVNVKPVSMPDKK